MTGEAARLPGQPSQCQSQATLCTVALPWVVIELQRHESCHVSEGPELLAVGSAHADNQLETSYGGSMQSDLEA